MSFYVRIISSHICHKTAAHDRKGRDVLSASYKSMTPKEIPFPNYLSLEELTKYKEK
jgi:uncharacterized protein YqfA (UPF0365 family)